jgi:putative radical SAM enzyme (TIGR03279 family)
VRNSRETTIEGVTPESPSALAGIAKGDVLLSINGHRVSDVIDYMFYKNEPELKISLSRRGKRFSVKLSMEETEDPGLELRHFKVRTCKNKCIFCFVSQLPRGLRKTLYVRDEDYRMSFLYGNYVTLTGLTAEDKKRIARQKLSPLYISVHATDRAVRNTMLGNPKAPDIMKDLRFLKDNKIRMHTQIVLCPGVNDGAAPPLCRLHRGRPRGDYGAREEKTGPRDKRGRRRGPRHYRGPSEEVQEKARRSDPVRI